jgi:hypothetical protein
MSDGVHTRTAITIGVFQRMMKKELWLTSFAMAMFCSIGIAHHACPMCL